MRRHAPGAKKPRVAHRRFAESASVRMRGVFSFVPLPPGQVADPILPPVRSQSSQTATRRAVATLQKVGLIVVPQQTQRLHRTQQDLVEYLENLNREYAVLRFAFRTKPR